MMGEGLMVLDEDNDWLALGRKQFEAAYADEDAVYEQLILEAHGR